MPDGTEVAAQDCEAPLSLVDLESWHSIWISFIAEGLNPTSHNSNPKPFITGHRVAAVTDSGTHQLFPPLMDTIIMGVLSFFSPYISVHK